MSKEVVLARYIGASSALDAFVFVFSSLTFLIGLVATPWAAAFLPRYAAAMAQESKTDAASLRRSAMRFARFTSLAASVLLIAGAAVATERLGVERDAILIAAILAPCLILKARAAIFGVILNLDSRFLTVSLAPAAIPLLVIASVAGLYERVGTPSIAFGALAGYALELFIVRRRARGRAFPERDPRSVRGTAVRSSAVVRSMVHQAGYMASAGAFMSSAPLVDQAVASSLGAGAVSHLSFASRVPAVLVTLGVGGVATVVYPLFADLAGRGEFKQFQHRAIRVLLVAALLGVVVTLSALAVSPTLVSVLYEGGEFSSADAVVVTTLQRAYVLQVPGFIIGVIAARLLNAVGRSSALFAISVGNFMLNVALDLALSHRYGLIGIPIATGIVYTTSSIATLIVLWRFFCSLPLGQSRIEEDVSS
jgi:putative peptidoglycan lipid II flippase